MLILLSDSMCYSGAETFGLLILLSHYIITKFLLLTVWVARHLLLLAFCSQTNSACVTESQDGTMKRRELSDQTPRENCNFNQLHTHLYSWPHIYDFIMHMHRKRQQVSESLTVDENRNVHLTFQLEQQLSAGQSTRSNCHDTFLTSSFSNCRHLRWGQLSCCKRRVSLLHA